MNYLTWPSLEWRLICLLAMFTIGGAGWNALAIRYGITTRAFPFLWMPIGWLSLTTISFVAMRIAILAKVTNPYELIATASVLVALAGAGWGLSDAGARAQILRPVAARANLTNLCVVIFATIAVANLTFLPLIQDGDALYFNGIGTDAYGYIRAAKAIQQGWYFEPMPEITEDHALRYPGRMWVYILMSMADRPGSYITVALTSTLTGTTALQGYFLAGSYLSALVLHLSLWVLSYFKPGALWLLGPCAALSSGLMGNYYQQFYGQCLGALALLMVPVLATGAVHSKWPAAVGIGFVIGLVPALSYGISLSALGCAVVLASLALSVQTRQAVPQALARGAALLTGFAGGAVLGGIPFRTIFQGPPRLFEIPFDLARFGRDAAIAGHPALLPLGLYLPLGISVAAALASLWFARRLQDKQQETLLLSLSLLLLAFAAAIGVSLAGGNNWAAYKTLYFLAPAAGLLLVGVAAAMRDTGWRKLSSYFALVPAIAGGIGAITICFYSDAIVRNDIATLRPRGMVSALAQARHPSIQAVYFDSAYIHRFLLFITEMEGSGKPIIAPFPLWRGGAGLALTPEKGKLMNSKLLGQFQNGELGKRRIEVRDSLDADQVKVIQLP